MEERNIAGYEVHTLDNMVGRRMAALCERDGLTQMQSWIISYLYENPSQAIFQKDLEAAFHIARSTATGILQLMEKRGFIYRESVPGDARLKRLVLTEKGVSHQLGVMHNLDNLEGILMSNISGDNLEVFFAVIRQMKQNIQDNPL
jgi:DNA-binding MarR family transcriptional regulator